MEFEIFFKDENNYNKKLFTIPSDNSIEFLKNLRLTVNNELENIKIDFLLVDKNINLKSPSSKDFEKKKVINKLIDIRKNNMEVSLKLGQLLSERETIICTNCGCTMHKTPIGVSYEKIGNRFMIKNQELEQNIKYHFACDSCFLAINEDSYLEVERNKILREKLLSEGECFVPNDFGMWNMKNGAGKNVKYCSIEESKQLKYNDISLDDVWSELAPFIKETDYQMKLQ